MLLRLDYELAARRLAGEVEGDELEAPGSAERLRERIDELAGGERSQGEGRTRSRGK